MTSRSEQIADLTKAIQRHSTALMQARKDLQRLHDEIRLAQVRLFKLEIEEEREPTFIKIPPNSL